MSRHFVPGRVFGLVPVLLVAALCVGCVATSTGPGLQEVRMEGLKTYALSLYASRSAEELSDVERITYFATHAVTGHRVPLFDPSVSESELPRQDGKPPARLCAVVGLDGLRNTNIACVCEALSGAGAETRFNTYVAAWDDTRGAWGTLSSVTHP